MRSLMVVVLLVSMLIPAGIAYAAESAPAAVSQVTDAGNKMCPVSGGPVSGKDFVTYGGKKYGLCCAGCEKEFLKDPAKYAKDVQ